MLGPVASTGTCARCVDVADGLSHMGVVLVGQVSLLLMLNVDDATSGMVPDRLITAVFLPAVLAALIRAQPFFEVIGRHISGIAEIRPHLVVVDVGCFVIRF